MKFIVDKMPCDSEECPFFQDKVCKIDFEECDYLNEPYECLGNTCYYHSHGKCYHLKPLFESEDTE